MTVRQVALRPRSITWVSGFFESAAEYPNNRIKTSKYTPATFLPLNLWEQLHKFGNVYFLSISVLMYLGEKTPLFVGTIKAASTLGTLMAMMALTALMAFLDDRKRDAADRETNNQQAKCIQDGKSESTKPWESIMVGDLLLVEQDKEFPADIVPMYCSGPEGSCYVSTANLDGETNLKLKAAPAAAQAALSAGGPQRPAVLQRLAGLQVSVDAEPPKASIHDFEGRLQLSGAAVGDESLGPKNLLLRGTMLRNTAWCLGIVVYTGSQTRMVMNSREAPLKQSNLERVTNIVMLVVLGAQAFMALVSDCLFLVSRDQYQHYWYLVPPDITLPDPIGYWLTFFVLYSNLMPISLYPTMEICNAAQSYFIKNDAKMYYKDKDSDFGMPAGAKSSTLCQELGQVNYIFSDKTGTLTQNVMELKRLLIKDKTYGTVREGQKGFNGANEMDKARRGGNRDEIDQLLEVLAVAHTVMVTKNADGSTRFEAESPDESALVEAVAKLGWAFAGASGTTRSVRIKDDSRDREQEYTLLATNQFDSDRKRMSVIVKRGEDYFLMCKGADNVMLDPKRAASVPPQLSQSLSEFAQEGLRTLVIARKKLDADKVGDWLERQRQAERQLGNREAALAEVAEEIETNMEVVGATAIEDKLQDKVPQTIERIREASIKLWVLTGDKLETARNIGFSSRVLTDEMHIATIDRVKDSEQVRQDLLKKSEGMRKAADEKQKVAMLITGAALEDVEANKAMKQDFLQIAQTCSIVIACRVSPLQKAQMVRMVRQGVKPTPVTLAIGDGANDVPMIQEAQVGVGIAGREGRQAMNNSDFSIGQFQYLQRLLFVHGRWNYRRVCKFTLFTFWRNAVQVLMIWYYTFISGFSGTSLFEDWIRLSFNFLCSFPIMATGCFDQDIDENTALANPKLYVFGREGKDLNASKIGQALLSAFTHSIILEGITLLAFQHMDLKGVGDYYAFGTAVYSCLLVGMNYRVAFLNYTHNKYTVGSIFLSFALYVVYLILYPCQKLVTDILAPNMYMVPWRLAQVPIFWLCLLTVPAIAMIVDMTIHTIHEQSDEWIGRVAALRREAAKTSSKRTTPVGGAYQPLQGDAGGTPSSGAEEEDPSVDPKYLKSSGLVLSPFAQQKLTGRRYFGAMGVSQLGAIVGILLFMVAAGNLLESTFNTQVRIHYEGRGNTWWSDPLGTKQTEVFKVQDRCKHAVGTTEKCRVTVTVPEDMKPPILLYYAVGPFYQNYNDYLKSEVTKELMGKPKDEVEALRETLCIEQTRIDASGESIVPCGMKATSVFNDTFTVEGFEIDKRGIAWASDVHRYQNPADYHTRQGVSWLFERYPDLVTEDEGVRNEQFAVWMRPSALWRVWNPYGFLQKELKKGQNLTVTIDSNYPVHPLDGYKQLVLTTTGLIGGRDHAFGYLLLLSALLCWIAALSACLLEQCRCPCALTEEGL